MAHAAAPGHRRSDTEIFAEARKALDDCPSIPATVRVHVEDGVAWLTGMARHAPEAAEAEAVVRQVPGVQRVVNKIALAEATPPQGFEPPEQDKR
jgi:osmotically-inducible protein OsmY